MTDKKHLVRIFPQKRTLTANSGERLLETLMRNSIFLRSDCGGKGLCHKCRVNMLKDNGEADTIDACRHQVDSDMGISIPESSVAPSHIMDKAPLFFPSKFTETFDSDRPDKDFGVAVDLGTTTIAIYLCSLATGKVLASTAVKNNQAIYGDDVMSRITAVVQSAENLHRMQSLAVKGIEWGVNNLFSAIAPAQKRLAKLVVVGNPTMIHILSGTDPGSIGKAPFLPAFSRARQFSSKTLGFSFPDIAIQTLPNVSGFLGGDILSAAVAVQINDQPDGTLLIDLGTNGELILKTENRLYATSCATGPAFEGATLSCGMQGIPGAVNAIRMGPNLSIDHISVIHTERQPDVRPQGICGTGILNIISEFCRNGVIRPNGAFTGGSDSFYILPRNPAANQAAITVSQKDIRSVQLGKSALISGIEFLLETAGIAEPEKIIIAGAMGAHVKIEDIIRLGMIPDIDSRKIEAAGNLAGSGAVMSLCDSFYLEQAIALSEEMDVIELAANKAFQTMFVKNLSFP